MKHKFVTFLVISMIVIGISLAALTTSLPAAGSPQKSPSQIASLPGGHTNTTWNIQVNPALDALCFIPSLTGDPFYLNHYQSEYNHFAPKLTPAVKDALAQIKMVIEQHGMLVCQTLTPLFLPLAPKNLDDLIKAVDNPETIRLGAKLSPDAEAWQLILSHIPNLRRVFSWLKEAGFEQDYQENIYPQIEARAKELAGQLPAYNIIPDVEAALGFALPSDRITIYLYHYVLPFGFGMGANQFIFYEGLDLNTIVDNSIHENLHLIAIQEPELWNALSFLQQDDYYMKNFQSNDPSKGYATFDQYLEEDVIEALDQVFAENFNAGEDARQRWSNVPTGMHKLSPVLYLLLKQENYSPAQETYHDFLIRMVKEGKLKAGMIESANRQFYANGSASTNKSNPSGNEYAQIDEFVLGEMKKASIPGLAYGIVKGDEIVHMQAFGVADNSGRQVTPQTPFEIGSVAKSFTALAIRQLINDGKVELNAPAQRYIPWFRLADPEASAKITIYQLLTHTSGISRADGNQAMFFEERYTLEELVRMMDKIQLNRPIGSSEEYSNLNFLILGQVVQNVSGQSYADYVRTNIFRPLGMEHSYLTRPEAVQNGLATGYHIWYGFPIAMQNAFPTGASADGWAMSTVEDLAHYLVAYLNQGSYRGTSLLLPSGSSSSPKAAKYYSIYWNEYSYPDARYNESQSGGTNNFNAMIMIMGEHSRGTYGIVVLMNTRPDLLVTTVNSQSFSDGISSLLNGGQPVENSWLSSVEWYGLWGLVDLGLLAMVTIALFEVFRIGRWLVGHKKDNLFARPAFFVWLGVDLLVGVLALAAFPTYEGRLWRDLLMPFCELCIILLPTGIILLAVAVVKIAWLIINRVHFSKMMGVVGIKAKFAG